MENLNPYVDEQPHKYLQAQRLPFIEIVISIVYRNIPNNTRNDKNAGKQWFRLDCGDAIKNR